MRTSLSIIVLAIGCFSVSVQAQNASPEPKQFPPVKTEYLTCLSLMETSLQKAMFANAGVDKVGALKAELAARQCQVALGPRITDPALLDGFMDVQAIYSSGISAPSALALGAYMEEAQKFLRQVP